MLDHMLDPEEMEVNHIYRYRFPDKKGWIVYYKNEHEQIVFKGRVPPELDILIRNIPGLKVVVHE